MLETSYSQALAPSRKWALGAVLCGEETAQLSSTAGQRQVTSDRVWFELIPLTSYFLRSNSFFFCGGIWPFRQVRLIVQLLCSLFLLMLFINEARSLLMTMTSTLFLCAAPCSFQSSRLLQPLQGRLCRWQCSAREAQHSVYLQPDTSP